MRPDHERLSNAPNENLDEAIEEALEGSVRAAELRQYIGALQNRQELIQRDIETSQDAGEKALLGAKLGEIDEQIQVLQEEAGINQFIEETVRFSHEVHRLSEG